MPSTMLGPSPTHLLRVSQPWHCGYLGRIDFCSRASWALGGVQRRPLAPPPTGCQYYPFPVEDNHRCLDAAIVPGGQNCPQQESLLSPRGPAPEVAEGVWAGLASPCQKQVMIGLPDQVAGWEPRMTARAENSLRSLADLSGGQSPPGVSNGQGSHSIHSSQ